MKKHLAEINQNNEWILHSDSSTDEKEFNIPMIRKVEFEKNNKEVIALY